MLYCLLCCTIWFYCLKSLWIKPQGVIIQMNANEQNFHVLLFSILSKVILTWKVCSLLPYLWTFNEYNYRMIIVFWETS